MRNTYIEGVNLPPNHPFRQEAERLAVCFDYQTYEQDGVIRWKSNGQVPPREVLDFWKHIGKEFNMSKCTQIREQENAQFLDRYFQREASRKLTQEEMYEIRSAYGTGVNVVDVVTGKGFRT